MSKNSLADPKKSGKLASVQANRRANESLYAAAERLNIPAEELGEELGDFYQMPFINLAEFEIDNDAVDSLGADQCRKYCVMPLSKAGTTLVIAFADPTNLFMRDDISYLTKCKIEPVVATEKGIRKAIEKYYREETAINAGDFLIEMSGEEPLEETKSGANAMEESEAPVVKFVNMMLTDAVKEGASDIHVEPYEKSIRIRFRKDGQLVEKYRPPNNLASSISSRLKVMARMDLAERRKPQDGRIKLKFKDKGDVDFRVNVLPVVDGEKVVMRIMDKSKITNIKLTELGFTEAQYATLAASLQKPQGLILVTGPTGSGKTTTLYASLQEIHDSTINISTAEDPVEFKLTGINQTQVQPDIGYTFAEALRAFLRQDPDVILVGEIRDKETAEISFKAASTGHLVLSTLHTNDAPGTVSRLIEMGIPGYLITSTVEIIIAQRLVGKICQACKTEDRMDPKMLAQLKIDPKSVKDIKFYKGQGCETCSGTGIKGRVAIYEFLPISDAIKEAVMANATPLDLKRAAMRGGMQSLRMSAIDKAKTGSVSLIEVLNSTMQDPEL